MGKQITEPSHVSDKKLVGNRIFWPQIPQTLLVKFRVKFVDQKRSKLDRRQGGWWLVSRFAEIVQSPDNKTCWKSHLSVSNFQISIQIFYKSIDCVV
jgi:hypothetical protein